MLNKATMRQVGLAAGFLIIPLLLVGAIILLTYRTFNLAVIIDLAAIAIALVIFAATNPVAVRNALGERSVVSWVNTVLLVVGFAGIMILVNILASRVTVRADTTHTGAFSISDASVKIAEKLTTPVIVYVAFSQSTNSTAQNAAQLLTEYKQHTDKLTVNQVNLDVNPAAATQLGIKSDPDIVLTMGTGKDQKRQEVATADEQSISRALLALQSGIQYRVFVVQGHNELPIASGQGGQNGLSLAAASQVLRDNNYLVDTLNLTTNATSGTDVKGTVTLNPQSDILWIAAPSSPFSDADLSKITTFLQQGGKALFFDNFTGQFPQQAGAPKTNTNAILSKFGVQFDTGLVLEEDPAHVQFQSQAASVPGIAGGQADITRNLNNTPIIMPNASAIEQIKDSPVISSQVYTALYQTTAQSYLRSDITNQAADHSKDKPGPFALAASVQLPAQPISGTTTPANPAQTRMVLFSSYLWPTDNPNVGLAQQPGSYVLLLNAANWLTTQPNSIVIPPKATNTHTFSITQSQDTFVFYSAFLGLPLVVLFIGLLVWWRRR